jgi:hypothetical protein
MMVAPLDTKSHEAIGSKTPPGGIVAYCDSKGDGWGVAWHGTLDRPSRSEPKYLCIDNLHMIC